MLLLVKPGPIKALHRDREKLGQAAVAVFRQKSPQPVLLSIFRS